MRSIRPVDAAPFQYVFNGQEPKACRREQPVGEGGSLVDGGAALAVVDFEWSDIASEGAVWPVLVVEAEESVEVGIGVDL